MPDDHTQKNIDRFNEAAPSWEDPSKVELALRITAAIRTEVPLNQNMRIMEYGCGTGLLCTELAPDVGHVLAVDISQGMLSVLEKKLPLSASNITLQLIDSEQEFSPGKSFGLIYSSMTLHHIQDPLKQLQRLCAWLQPGGFLAIADLCEDSQSFHQNTAGVAHHGFRQSDVVSSFAHAGLTAIRYSVPCTFKKPDKEGRMKEFSVFLCVGKVEAAGELTAKQ